MKTILNVWNKLDHRWKKQFLINFDFNERFENDPGYIRQALSYASQDTYFSVFKQGIRKRMDEFDATEESLNRMIGIKSLTIGCPDTKGFEFLSLFNRIEYLDLKLGIPSFFDQISPNLNVKSLNISGNIERLDGISKWINTEVVSFGYCDKLEGLKELNDCKGIQRVNMFFLGGGHDISCLTSIAEISVHYLTIHCDNEYYNRQYNLFKYRTGMTYRIKGEERSVLMKNLNQNVKNNFIALIDSGLFEIIISDYSRWTLKSSNHRVQQIPSGSSVL